MALKIVLYLILAFIGVILLRTLIYGRPPKERKEDEEVIDFDEYKVVSNLQKLIRCETVSNSDPHLENNKEFKRLIDSLEKLYPNVYAKTTLMEFEGRGLLFKWKGKSRLNPAVFMSHYDVVSVDKNAWSKPAFDGLIEKDIMWGRGTLDTKNTFNGILCAVDYLIDKKFIPEHDIYLAFSGSEEIAGKGAENIVSYLQKNKITPSFVLDEGGAIVSDMIPGVEGKSALVGICEKGDVYVSLTAKSNSGHASMPKPNSPIIMLSKACLAIEKHPFKARIEGPVNMMFKEFSKYASFMYKVIYANMWCFSWLVDLIACKDGGLLNSHFRTTTAFTMSKGSNEENVVPVAASVTLDVRINPNETVDMVVEELRKIINNENIEITTKEESEPCKVSPIDCDSYKLIKEAIEDTWYKTHVVPYLMVQASDSRHYDKICDNVYRFSAVDMNSQQLDSIHGNDENIRVESVKRAVEFFIRVMRKC